MLHESLSDDKFFQFYTAVWQNIGREDNNIASRVGWAIGLSTGLFAAIAFITPRINDYSHGLYWPPVLCLAIASMATLGVFFCYRTMKGVEAAHEQIAYLRGAYLNLRDDYQHLRLPRPFGDSHQGLGRKSSGIYPIALLLFWLAILLVSLGGSVVTLTSASTGSHPVDITASCEITKLK